MYLKRWPANAPPKVSSDKPSGNGITAASVWAGEPPIKIETFKGFPNWLALLWCTPIPLWIW